MIPFTPFANRVVIKPDPVVNEIETGGGLVLPQSDAKSVPITGTVVAVGSAAEYTEVDSRVTWSRFTGSVLNIAGEEYLVMRETDLIGELQ